MFFDFIWFCQEDSAPIILQLIPPVRVPHGSRDPDAHTGTWQDMIWSPPWTMRKLFTDETNRIVDVTSHGHWYF